jgi:hypothetical protein
MSDKLFQKLAAKTPDKVVTMTSSDEADGVDDLGSFGWLRGVRERGIMLELRKANGNVRAIGYGWLEKIDFNPSQGITLYVGADKIRIKGRNLNAELRPLVRLFQGLARHRVPWVQEGDDVTAMRAGKGATVVEAIEW